MILALSGKKGSGKTTIANQLLTKGFELRSFARPLKKLMADVYDLPMFLFTDPEAKEKTTLSIELNRSDIHNMIAEAHSTYYPIPIAKVEQVLANIPNTFITSPRQLLQVVGTDIFRNHVGADYWLKVLKNSLLDGKNYIIDDARFPNELDMIKALGGFTIGLSRPGADTSDTHASEAVNLTNCDFIIHNRGSIKDLQAEVEITYDLIKGLNGQNSRTK